MTPESKTIAIDYRDSLLESSENIGERTQGPQMCLNTILNLQMNVAVDKGNVYFLQVLPSFSTNPLYSSTYTLISSRSGETLTLPSWCCVPTPWTRCSTTRTTTRCRFLTSDTAVHVWCSLSWDFIASGSFTKKRSPSTQPFRTQLCCPCTRSFSKALFSDRAAYKNAHNGRK